MELFIIIHLAMLFVQVFLVLEFCRQFRKVGGVLPRFLAAGLVLMTLVPVLNIVGAGFILDCYLKHYKGLLKQEEVWNYL